jgi:hypothetical protein
MRIAFEGNKRFKDMFVGFHALIYIFVSVDLDSRVTGSPRSLCIFNSNLGYMYIWTKLPHWDTRNALKT